MPTRTIYLVRHGQENKETRPNELGGMLTDLGEAQARVTADFLQPLPITAIHASTLRRAKQTAEILAPCFPHLTLKHTNLLWECVPTVPPALEDAMANVSPEQLQHEQARIALAYDRYFQAPLGDQDQHDLIVCHGNLIRYFVCRVLETPLDMWINLEIFNCGVTCIEVRGNGRKVLVYHNSHTHLRADRLTFV